MSWRHKDSLKQGSSEAQFKTAVGATPSGAEHKPEKYSEKIRLCSDQILGSGSLSNFMFFIHPTRM